MNDRHVERGSPLSYLRLMAGLDPQIDLLQKGFAEFLRTFTTTSSPDLCRAA